MANVRDSDTSLWLHNKLGTSNDSWTGGSICSQLNAEVLRNIKDCFPDLQTQVKLKLLLSFFHIPRRNIEEWRVEMEEILEVAMVDSEQWVSMLAEMMRTIPSAGCFNDEISENEENRRIFSDLVNDLRKLVRKNVDLGMLPLECHYLNKSALISVVGQQPVLPKHFTLKRKPKSAALRAELLQKSADAMSNMKKSTAPTVPVRSRGMPRKMTDTTPLKGIPSRVPTGGFRSPSLNNPLLSRPSLSRTPAGRKDGGIKLLDINEQPLGYAQAKKRKRMQELEEAKRAAEAAQAATPTTTGGTPDYAAGLTALNPATPQPVYTPTTAPGTTAAGLKTDPSNNQVAETVTVPASPAPPVVHTTTTTVPVVQLRQPQQHTIVAKIPASTNKPSLSLTREHMLEAQDMFRTSNKVTRPEKALILGFMAGSRDNPCPQLGNIVTIKLSENQENVKQPDDTYLTMLVETHFQMNYNTGEWKRIQKYRELDIPTQTATTVATTPTAAATPTT
ncbi:negative elongation factor A [Macrosteles quadrilineatus]|uniref:negative elongation factor A n=1 Tax=Macrosteles quadrilineatus TaxID=74068 RepID=UPI0023E3364D|nr:negative elongation factor A [Macrosteles quadrilineatus]